MAVCIACIDLYSISAFFSWSIDNPVGPTVAGRSVKVWIHRWSWFARIIHIDSDSSSIHQSIQNMSKLFGQQPFPIYIYKQFAIISDLRRFWPAICEIDIKSPVFQVFFSKSYVKLRKVIVWRWRTSNLPRVHGRHPNFAGLQSDHRQGSGHGAGAATINPRCLEEYRFSWELQKEITVLTGNSLN